MSPVFERSFSAAKYDKGHQTLLYIEAHIFII